MSPTTAGRSPHRGACSAALLSLALLAAACQGNDGERGSGSAEPDTTAPTGDGDASDIVEESTSVWPMHEIDGRWRGANALGRGDVNGDHLADYVTNYEFDQHYVIALHPGQDEDVRLPWPTITLRSPTAEPGRGSDTENAALADLDGDGSVDIVGAQGGHPSTPWDGFEPGVRVLFAPAADEDPAAWFDAGRFPDTVEAGHYLWVLTDDVNGDGALDVLAGGRRLYTTGRTGGVVWIEAPTDPAERRDLSAWRLHAIDPDQPGGHGFVPADVDEDGDRDLVLANADFDTPDDEEQLLWYENPGPGDPAQDDPWPEHVVYRGGEFDGKPQVAVADLDTDFHDDLVTMTADDVYWFRKVSTDPVEFERVVIPKDPLARGFTRPVKVADINGDGRLDVVGMLVHTDGVLPAESAAVFWMEYEGAAPTTDNWTTHVIKWGSGRTMQIDAFGEKWDQVDVTDVDGDGDLDLVANCEEWWENPVAEVVPFSDPGGESSHSVAVVWFENPLGDPPRRFSERDGSVVIEAEHWTGLGDSTWVERADYAGAAGAYLQAFNGLDVAVYRFGDTEGAAYEIEVEGGRYRVWIRRYTPSRWGQGLGGPRSDDVLVGFDGRQSGTVGPVGPTDTWEWVPLPDAIDLPAGFHTLDLQVSEHGAAIDRIVLTTDPSFVPTATGPAETLFEV